MKAIVIGATGATGKELVKQLLENVQFSEVVAFVRRPQFVAHPKLREVKVDFDQMTEQSIPADSDFAFSCMGTTLKDAGSKEAQWLVDHDYQLHFAQLCRARGVRHFVLLSAVGANKDSSLFYNKMKGRVEDGVSALRFPKFTIVQPSLILRPGSKRTGEVIAGKVLRILNNIGLFRNYKPITTADLAQFMIITALQQNETTQVVGPDDYDIKLNR